MLQALSRVLSAADRKALLQLQGLDIVGYTATTTITAGVAGTLARSDGTGTTLTWSALVAGESNAGIFVDHLRKSGFGGKALFDVTVYHPDEDNAAGTTVTRTASDVLTQTAHGYATGDGPFAFTTSAADLPAGLDTTSLYWIVKLTADTFSVASSLANAVAGTPTVVAITDAGTGTHKIHRKLKEEFRSCSMDTDDPRYVETVINTGVAGHGPSKWVTVADSENGHTENRPSNGYAALAAGSGEVAVSGVERGDHLIAVNITTGALCSAGAGAFVCPTSGKVVLSTGTFVTANNDIVRMLKLPAQD